MLIWICRCETRFALRGMAPGHESNNNNNNKLRGKCVPDLASVVASKDFLVFLLLLYMKTKVLS